jgi:hypothetical protein
VDKLPERAERPRFSGNPGARIENQRYGQVAAFALRNRDSGLQLTFLRRTSGFSTGEMFSANREI